MANDDDLRAALDGQKDLVRYDLSGADLSGRDFAGADFSSAKLLKTNFGGSKLDNCVFSDILHQTNFQHASLRQARFEGALVGVHFTGADLTSASLANCHLSECYFDGANLTNADFTGATFNEGNTFSDVIFDALTKFDDVRGMPLYSSLPMLSGYRFARGIFTRQATATSVTDHRDQFANDIYLTEVDDALLSNLGAIKKHIAGHPNEVVATATNLYVLIEDYLRNPGDKPNDADQLDRYQQDRDLLLTVAKGLAEIIASLTASQGQPSIEAVSQAAGIANSVGKTIIDYLQKDPVHVVAGVRSSALIGLSSYFLMQCGCDSMPATLYSIAQFGAADVVSRLQHLVKAVRGE